MDLIPTPWQTVGPYLHIGMTNAHSVACIAGPAVEGERILLELRLLDGDGAPVPDGMIEIWQANAEGKYNHPEDAADQATNEAFLGFGRLATAEDGKCSFETIKPGRVAAPDGKLQAPHLNVGVFGRGLLKRLVTRIYFAGDAANPSDPVLELVPEGLRHTLIAQPDGQRANGWKMDIHLCGEAETVFFDV
jgi:protocatechuate 3,4-dioxygenase alpha subunit